MSADATIQLGAKTLYLQPDNTYKAKRPASGLTESNRANVRAKMRGEVVAKEHKPKRKNKHEESDMQQRCVAWFRFQYKRELLFAVPNGGKSPGTAKERAIAGKRLEKEGVLAGVSDLILVCDGSVTFLEAKTEDGTQSDEQRLFQAMAEAMGWPYFIFRSLEEFQRIVRRVIDG